MSLRLCLWLAVVALLAIPLVGASITSDCVDTDNGAQDAAGYGCDEYDVGGWHDVGGCGLYDTTEFVSAEMCCACGSGQSAEPSSSPALESAEPSGSPTLESAEPSSSPTLESAEPSSQSSSQPSSQSSSQPSNEASSQPSSSPTTAPQQTTCRDLKIVYQNYTCCGLNTTKAATFTNTPTTCRAVLDSYKSSACCSESLDKSAVMNF